MTFRNSTSISSAQCADFVERVRAHAQQQRLEGLSGPEDADVRLRRRRQHAAQRVERLRADGGAMDRVGVLPALLRIAPREVLLHRRDPSRVALERLVERPRVTIAQRAARARPGT